MAYTTEKIFDREHAGTERVLTVKPNGGGVVIAYEHAPDEFLTFETITGTTVKLIKFGQGRVKITPSGGAEFNIV